MEGKGFICSGRIVNPQAVKFGNYINLTADDNGLGPVERNDTFVMPNLITNENGGIPINFIVVHCYCEYIFLNPFNELFIFLAQETIA